MLDPAQLARIRARLIEKKVTGPCPRCAHPEFVVLDRVANPSLYDDLEDPTFSSITIPSIVTACSRCGFLSLHAIGTLGFLVNGKIVI
jgi:hypothetical protein